MTEPRAMPGAQAAGITFNPGAGPVGGETDAAHADLNLGAFIADLGLRDISLQRGDALGRDGRLSYTLTHDGRTCEVDMPAISLAEVRYTGADDQNIWDFPRLFVDGSSWVWKYAVDMARNALTGDGAGEGEDED